MTKTVLVPIAQGTEEVEAITVIDLLRRAGANVKVAGENEIVTCSRRVRIIPDVLLDDLQDDEEFDAIVVPGGSLGVKNLSQNHKLIGLLKAHYGRGALVSAICAAPSIFAENKIVRTGTKLTSFPGMEEQFEGYDYRRDDVLTDGNVITSRGAGTAVPFALRVIAYLFDDKKAKDVADDIVYTNP